MLDKFWEAVAGKLADRWAGVAAPSLLFWAGGVLAWVFAGAGWSRLVEITTWLGGQNLIAQIAVVTGTLTIVVASGLLVHRLTNPVLRLLEGYWPRCLRALTTFWLNRVCERRRADDEARQQLSAETDGKERKDLSASQLAEGARLEDLRRRRPLLTGEMLPTRVGNILRAAETRPYHRYGLDAVSLWPRMWLVLPDLARQELTGARASLDTSVAAMIWGLGFLLFTPLAWWTVPVGIAVAAAAVLWWIPARAEVFADLVEAAFDLYRNALYTQLRWPLPATPAEEVRSGLELTEYLVLGSDECFPKFTPSKSSSEHSDA